MASGRCRASAFGRTVVALMLVVGASGAIADATDAMQWILSGDCRRAGDAINEGIQRNEAKSYALAGYLYASTGCVTADLPRAAKYYQRAIELGDNEARAVLGVMYGLGEGVPQDYRTAYRWFTYGKTIDRIPTDSPSEIAAGYAMTVTQLARSKVRYPKNARGDEGTLFVTFRAETGAVTLARDSGTGRDESRHLKYSLPFANAITDAYAEALNQVAKPDEGFARDYAYEVPWTFQLK